MCVCERERGRGRKCKKSTPAIKHGVLYHENASMPSLNEYAVNTFSIKRFHSDPVFNVIQ